MEVTSGGYLPSRESEIVKNALYLKKARVPSRMNAKKYIAVDIYLLSPNQSAHKVIFTC